MKLLKITQLTLISLMIVFGLFRSPAMAQPSSGINQIEWSPDGTKLAGASFTGPIYIWDRAGQLVETLPGHSDGSVSVAWSPDGNLLASSGIDGYSRLIKVWDISTSALVQTLAGFVDGVGQIAFSPNGEQLIGTGFSEVKVWDTITWDIVAEPPIGTINDVKWSPDGTMVAFAMVAGIPVVDATTYQRLVVFGDTALQPYGIDWSRDGQYLVSGGRAGTIRLWDMTTFTPIGSLAQPDIIVEDVAFSPDRSQVAAALDDGTARVWDVASGEQLSVFQQNGEMWSVAWSPDEAILAYGGRASDEAEILQLPLANAGLDQTLPDVDSSGAELVTLDGSASTDPDGTIVAYSWTDETGAEIATDPTPSVDLPVGVHTVTLTVADDDGLTASDTVVVTVTSATGCVPPDPPLTGDYTVAASDVTGLITVINAANANPDVAIIALKESAYTLTADCPAVEKDFVEKLKQRVLAI